MLGYFRVVNAEGYPSWVRADEVGAFYGARVRPRGPATKADRGVDVITLLLRNGVRVHAAAETEETIVNKMQQALGEQLMLVEDAVFHETDRRRDFRKPTDPPPILEDAEAA
jgi:hypothetical protein